MVYSVRFDYTGDERDAFEKQARNLRAGKSPVPSGVDKTPSPGFANGRTIAGK
jgi:hypothetical protein